MTQIKARKASSDTITFYENLSTRGVIEDARSALAGSNNPRRGVVVDLIKLAARGSRAAWRFGERDNVEFSARRSGRCHTEPCGVGIVSGWAEVANVMLGAWLIASPWGPGVRSR
uniref:hypothetical protein n=1 Tax=unclassified Mesorhizobium TaxID=325217 RepID=UPI00192574EC|nr:MULTISPECIES: hypothetical protein [unclassified Mesorhizobium]